MKTRPDISWKALAAVLFGLAATGLCPVQLKDVEKAVIQEDYGAAERLARDFIDRPCPGQDLDAARYYLGLSLLFQEKTGPAREIFTRIVQARPEQPLLGKARIGVIDSYLLSGEYEAALAKAKKLLKGMPGSAFQSLITLKIARANLKLARWDEARKNLRKIIADFPDSLEAHRARQLLEEKQFFSVQVGSFLDQQRAEALASELKDRGEYAFVVETIDKTGKKFYRVRIGRFSGLDEAQQMKDRLSELGYPTLIYP